MSHNTHVTYANKLRLVLSHGTHHCHTQLPRFPELRSMLKLGCYQVLTLSLVYSIVFSHILSTPDLCISLDSDPVLSIHVYITLLCSPLHPHILQLPAIISDSIY